MSLLPLQAGLTVGDLILAVNKDTLLGSTYDAVSTYRCMELNTVHTFINVHQYTSLYFLRRLFSYSHISEINLKYYKCTYIYYLLNMNPLWSLQASSLLKKTEGVVTLVVCNPRKDDSGTAVDQKSADKPKQPEKPSESILVFTSTYYVYFLFCYKLFCFLLHDFLRALHGPYCVF